MENKEEIIRAIVYMMEKLDMRRLKHLYYFISGLV